MMEWWSTLTALERIFATIAVPATLILIVQTVMTILGFGGDSDGEAPDDLELDTDSDLEVDTDADSDVDTDSDSDGGDHSSDLELRIFTLRGFVAFFAIFGWSGLCMLKGGVHTLLSIGLAVVFGFLAMLAVAAVVYFALYLQSDGTMDPRNAVGKEATVYLTIPPKRGGKGKVNVLVQERLTELPAVTDSESAIPSGGEVVVVELLDQNTLLVREK